MLRVDDRAVVAFRQLVQIGDDVLVAPRRAYRTSVVMTPDPFASVAAQVMDVVDPEANPPVGAVMMDVGGVVSRRTDVSPA